MAAPVAGLSERLLACLGDGRHGLPAREVLGRPLAPFSQNLTESGGSGFAQAQETHM